MEKYQGNIKGRGEESHREHEEGKSCRMLRESGVDMMHEILKKVWEEEQMPEE